MGESKELMKRNKAILRKMFLSCSCSDVSGTNFYSPETKMLGVTVKGKEPVYIEMMPIVVLSFGVPTLSIDEFFDVNLRENLATLLNVPKEKIKVCPGFEI